MPFPSELHQMHQTIAQHFPDLRPAQQRGLTQWDAGRVCAGTSASGYTAAQTGPGLVTNSV